jgi:hypothetical protein
VGNLLAEDGDFLSCAWMSSSLTAGVLVAASNPV